MERKRYKRKSDDDEHDDDEENVTLSNEMNKAIIFFQIVLSARAHTHARTLFASDVARYSSIV